MKQAAIFCEGYQDRALISSWLDERGAVRAPVNRRDVFKKRLGDRLEIRIVPMKGSNKLGQYIGDYLVEATTYERLLVVLDADELTAEERERRTRAALASVVPSGTVLDVAVWMPRLESHLERALRKTWPDRMVAIDAFLGSRPSALPRGGKEGAFSYCAGWEPDTFGEAFYGWSVRNPATRSALEAEVPGFAQAIDRILALARE